MDQQRWWQGSVIYEIAVPSFQDSSGDGWGDLTGLSQRLDYVRDLGVGSIWLTPIMKSPMFDLGYDVADHTDVDPAFGSIDDFDQMLAAAHDRELRVIIDFVPNHTSVEHSWFQESRASRENSRRDWYLWRDPAPGGRPPNNWINRFGKSAWGWDEATRQYYLGWFSSQQPDLNWRNAGVRRAMFGAMRFWLDRGVDGLRIDALPHLLKDGRLRDNPPNTDFNENSQPQDRMRSVFSQNLPGLLDVIRDLRSVIDEYDDRVLVGEVYQSAEQITAYQYAGAQLLLNTSVLQVDFESRHLRGMIDLVEGRTAIGAWPAHSSGNHDIGRIADRVDGADLRLAALLHLCVRGTPTIYYGEELGLRKATIPADRLRDPSGLENRKFGRDGFRVPMPWSRSPNAGFSPVEPWLPIDELTIEKNVFEQIRDPDSLLNFYRRLIRFRNDRRELQAGDYTPIDTPQPVLSFVRGDRCKGLLVALNVSDMEAEVPLHEHFSPSVGATIHFSTHVFEEVSPTRSLRLRPREGVVAQLQGEQA